MSKFAHHKYTWSKPWNGSQHHWSLVGPNGAISFQVYESTDDRRPTAGLEFHRLAGNGEAPSQLNCPLTGGLCWHDGTSLYATESLWPSVEFDLANGDHESIFRRLEHEYEKHFGGQD